MGKATTTMMARAMEARRVATTVARKVATTIMKAMTMMMARAMEARKADTTVAVVTMARAKDTVARKVEAHPTMDEGLHYHQVQMTNNSTGEFGSDIHSGE